jgi:hypothetical protein
MAQKRQYRELAATGAVVEQLREDTRLLRELLSEAYFKIAFLEASSSEARSKPSEQPDEDYRWTH